MLDHPVRVIAELLQVLSNANAAVVHLGSGCCLVHLIAAQGIPVSKVQRAHRPMPPCDSFRCVGNEYTGWDSPLAEVFPERVLGTAAIFAAVLAPEPRPVQAQCFRPESPAPSA